MSRASTAGLYEDAFEQMVADAQVFSSLMNGVREHLDRIHKVASIVRDKAPESLLDVGCSMGIIGGMLRLNHGSVKHLVGLDWSRSACDFARTQMGYDDVITGDAEAWHPGLRGKFDMVLALEILEHVVEPQAVIANVFAWTKRWALFSVPVEDGEVDGEFHVRKVPWSSLKEWIQKAGFRIVTSEFLPSEFCEPRWKGWVFVLADKGEIVE